ncbi:hypothetical protein T01_6404, partial [Trichinella spiralis]
LNGNMEADWVVVYKAPAQNAGKAFVTSNVLLEGAGANAWQNIPDVTRDNGHAVFKPLEHVIAANQNNRFN